LLHVKSDVRNGAASGRKTAHRGTIFRPHLYSSMNNASKI